MASFALVCKTSGSKRNYRSVSRSRSTGRDANVGTEQNPTLVTSFLEDLAGKFPDLVGTSVSLELAEALENEGLKLPVDIGLACPELESAASVLSEVMPGGYSTNHLKLFIEAVRTSRASAAGWASTHVHVALKDSSSGSRVPALQKGVLRFQPFRPSGIQINNAMTRLTKQVDKVLHAPSDGVALACVTGFSSKRDLDSDWETVIQKCFALLMAFGDESPRWVELFSGKEPSPAHWEVQADTFRMGCDAPATVDGHRETVLLLHDWTKSLGFSLCALTHFDVAAFLRDQHTRGKTVPLKSLRGLVWAEKCFGWCLHAAHATVVSQSRRSYDATAQKEKTAAMATVDMVKSMEDLIVQAPTLPLRIFAGVMVLLAHGVLRWKDVQRSEHLNLT